jgi:hypothetical protein
MNMASAVSQGSQLVGKSSKGDCGFTDKNLLFIVKFIAGHASIVMSDAKVGMVG